MSTRVRGNDAEGQTASGDQVRKKSCILRSYVPIDSVASLAANGLASSYLGLKNIANIEMG